MPAQRREVAKITKINAWNPERLLERRAPDTVVDALTTGNFGGFDAYLAPGAGGRLEITTNHGTLTADLDDLLKADGAGRRRLGGKYAPSAYRWKTRTARSASRPVCADRAGRQPAVGLCHHRGRFPVRLFSIYAFNGAAAR